MFYIEARYNNAPVQLKQGKNYEVSIPAARDYDDMKVFTGSTDSSGISWDLIPESFSMTSLPSAGGKPDSSYAKDSAVIQNWKIQAFQDTLLYGFSLDIVTFPAKPAAPVKPVTPSRMAVERFEKQNPDRFSRKKRAAYNLAVSKYDADIKRFDSAIEKYRTDSTEYKYRLTCYNDSMNNYRQELNMARRKLWAFRYAVLEDDIVKKWPVIKRNLIIMNNKGKFNFIKADSITRNLAMHYNKLSNKNPHYERLQHSSLQLYQAYRKLYPNSAKYADYSKWFKNEGDGGGIYLFDGYINANINMLLAQDTAVNNYFAGNQPPVPVMQKFLSASLNQMGWINCDRFYNYPPQNMTELYVQANNGRKEQAYIIFRSMNSVLNMSLKPSNTYAANIPKEMPFTLLIIGLDENNNPVYYIEKFDQLQQPKNIAPRYTTYSISELPGILEQVM